MIEIIEKFGAFLLGAAASGFVAYLNTRNKHAAKISSIESKLSDILRQQQAISQATEVGKIQALTTKIDEVISQQEKLTTSSELIKSKIDFSNWRTKESITLRREKAEELYSEVNLMSQKLQNYLKTSFTAPQIFEEFNTVNAKIDMLLHLYFSDLDGFAEVHEFHSSARSEIVNFLLKYPAQGKEDDLKMISVQLSYVNFSKHLANFLVASINKDLE